MIGAMLAPTDQSRSVGNAAFADLPSLLGVLIRFRAVVIAGGQWLHDLSAAKHCVICTLLAIARLSRTQTGVFCIGAGPLRSAISRRLLRVCFSRDSLIVTRDNASTALLRSCGLRQAQTASDPAIELKSSDARTKAGVIFISPCAWSSFDNLYMLDQRRIEESLASWQRLLGALKTRGERVAILPTMNPEDRLFARRIGLGHDDVDIIETDDLTPGQVQSHIASAKALVSMRLHPIIFASNVRTPFVALTYADKVRAYCEQAGFESRLVSPAEEDWPSQVLNRLDSPTYGAVAAEARKLQEVQLAEAYSQFFNWLRLGCSPATSILKQAVPSL